MNEIEQLLTDLTEEKYNQSIKKDHLWVVRDTTWGCTLGVFDLQGLRNMLCALECGEFIIPEAQDPENLQITLVPKLNLPVAGSPSVEYHFGTMDNISVNEDEKSVFWQWAGRAPTHDPAGGFQAQQQRFTIDQICDNVQKLEGT
jgi:hypothetical protein